jgi:hypothetical protein
MKHKIIIKANGKFGLQLISSGCIYGDFDSFAEAVFAIALSNLAATSIGVGQ